MDGFGAGVLKMEETKHVQGLVHFTALCQMCAAEKTIRSLEAEIGILEVQLEESKKDLEEARMNLAAMNEKLKDAGL